MINTILLVIILSCVMAIFNNSQKNDKQNGDFILQFGRPIINLFLVVNIFLILALIIIFIAGIRVDNKNNILGIFIIFFAIFSICAPLYVFFSKKKIIITGENIKVYKIFGDSKIYTFNDIAKIKDNPGNNIVLYMKNKEKFSVDYQMDNFINFKDILISKNIIKNKEK